MIESLPSAKSRGGQPGSKWLVVLMVCTVVLGVWILDALIGAALFYEAGFADLLVRSLPAGVLYSRILLTVLTAILTVLYLHKRASTAQIRRLQLADQCLIAISESTQAFILMTDTNGRVTFMNTRAVEISGSLRNTARGQDWTAACTLDFDQEVETGFPVQQVLSTKQAIHVKDCVIVSSKGRSMAPVLGTAAPLIYQSGDLAGCILVLQDVSELRQSEASQRRLSSAVDQAPDAILITDFTGRLQVANRAVFKMFNLTPDTEIIGRAIWEFASRVSPNDWQDSLKTTLEAGNTWRHIITLPCADEQPRIVHVLVSPVLEADDVIIGYAVIARDITVEESLKQENQQTQKMQAVGTLANGICHDFNNLLTVIFGYSDLLMLEMKEESGAYEHAKAINCAAVKGKVITQQLLDFCRKDSIAPDTIHVNEVIRNLRDVMNHLLPETIEFKLELEEDLALIRASISLFRQSLVNLCVNAGEAMADGGVLQVLTRQISRSSEDPNFTGMLMIEVRDTGCGMSPEVMDRMFDPFFSTKSTQQNAGMGLSLVYGFVQQYGADIKVKSTPGEGTVIQIYIPTIPSRKKLIGTQASVNFRPEGGSQRLLLVDDDELVRRALVKILGIAGYSVTSAANGDEAMQHFGQGKYDMVITDVIMPGMTATDMVDTMRRQQAELPVVYMSGHAGHQAIVKVQEDSRGTFLEKPFMPDKLLRTVKRMFTPKI